MAQSGIYPKFRADDRDGEPLSGGRLYSYASGTSTPKALYADADLQTPLTNPVILDASGEALFYYDGGAYALELRDADEVPQWVIDPVTGGFGGSTGVAGMGIGRNTILLRPAAGASVASGSVFPQDVLAVAVTVTITETLGGSQGVEKVGVGYGEQPDAWGVLATLTATRDSTAGGFLAYSGVPQPSSGTVTLTAYGGLFDGSGAVLITGHFFHFSPGDTVGYTYLPGTPEAGQIIPPMPGATETQAGMAEIATTLEVTGATDDSRIVTPLKLQQRLTAVHSGTPLKVMRYTAAGTGEEATPGLYTSTAGTGLGVNTAPEGTNNLHVQGNILETQGIMTLRRDGAGQLRIDMVRYGTGGLTRIIGEAAGGTMALPTATPTNTQLLSIEGLGHDGNAFGGTIRTQIEMRTAEQWSPTAQGSTLAFLTTTAGTTTSVYRMYINGAGNLGIGTTAPNFPLHVTGRVAQGVPNTAPTDTNLGNNQMTVWVNGSTLTFRVRDNAGTLRTATLALT